MRRAGLRGLLQHSSLLVLTVGFPDDLSDLQLERLLLAKSNTNQVAWLAQNAQKESDLFIDGFWGGALPKAIVLILRNGRLVKVHQHFASEQALQMVDSVLGEGGRIGQSNLVAVEELLCHIPKGANSFVTPVGDVVEGPFQFAPSVLLSFLCEGLGRGFCGLANPLTGEPELVPIHPATWKDCHFMISAVRLRPDQLTRRSPSRS
ncbi:MAG: hypothetical protein WB524_12590 [Acidobacteriaceae bacterium]